MKVLIADDEATSRILMEETLLEWGYEPVCAADGLEAKAILEQPDAPNFAILDWMMPGMDGPELCRWLRETQSSQYMYIILLTSKGERKDVILGMDAGADAFLIKPVDLEELKIRLAAGKRILEHQSRLAVEKLQPTRIQPRGETSITSMIDSAGLEAIVHSAQDLRHDALLAFASRRQIGTHSIPTLGKILILNKIGEGGMGAVYRGYNPRIQRMVAVKVLSSTLFRQNVDAAARFYREAQIAALVKSDHLVSVSDVDQENGVVYLIMELVEGKTATDCLKHKLMLSGDQALSEEIALDMCIGATKGLAAAHAGGIVHRDVKPDNILIPYNEARTELDFAAAKLADLGIARHELSNSGLTEEHQALGTAGFMAPEQIQDARSAGKAADVFGLGATLYVLLCGRTPFMGASSFDVFNATIQKPHKPVQSWRPDASPTVAAIVDACLAKNPAERYADGSALLEDLIYCRRLLETRKPSSPRSSVMLPRVIEQPPSNPVFINTPDPILQPIART